MRWTISLWRRKKNQELIGKDSRNRKIDRARKGNGLKRRFDVPGAVTFEIKWSPGEGGRELVRRMEATTTFYFLIQGFLDAQLPVDAR